MNEASGSPRWVLPTVDALALTAFVLVGIRSHHDAGGIPLFARNAVPLLVAWFVAAPAVGTYRRPGLRSLVSAWAVAIPAGLLMRSVWVGSPTGGRLLVFLAVGLAFTLLFLLIGRGLVRIVARRGLPAERRT